MRFKPTRRELLGMAAVAALATALPAGRAVASAEAEALRRALAAAAAGRWPDALAAGEAAGPLGHDVIRWLWLREGGGTLGDYEDFIARRADWPGMPWLRMKGEAAVVRSQTPARVAAYFKGTAPRTAEGRRTLSGRSGRRAKTRAPRGPQPRHGAACPSMPPPRPRCSRSRADRSGRITPRGRITCCGRIATRKPRA